MADRGLYASWLFQAIIDCGWHPFLRINLGVKARAVDEEIFDWISRWTPVPGTRWKGTAECFSGKGSRLTCTLLIHWEAGYESPWAVLTDLEPEEAEVSWYGMRTRDAKPALRISSAACGAGITAKWWRPVAWSHSGWRWPWPNSGR